MKRIRLGLAVLVVVAAVAAVLAGCGSEDVQTPTATIDIAKDQAAKSEIMLVKTGVAAYIQMNGVAPPNASEETLGAFVQPWPKDPWTQAPMKQGKEPGDIAYAPGAGTAYTLGVVVSDGSVYNAP